ncbi:lactaldehyde reductase [Mannheimia haemolytica]|uniref:lactaldehyde reductase n=1 Tax=Mannheimia haemolytica TaxID=75985 RepID=UPI000386E389|nr:lactaldehyde reductase [Mannheimia haemolytica]EPZ00282.1 L-1,2-propanediol oxidoreductase [Mannheimia haemolytica D35]MDW1150157.1 lactaldehyde reductase [Mannheimia haemolytica]MDW1160368.1 lactaldehyde reductase [Mannheimia haemolytica]NBB67277.1 lactaldehyde reductase [Mannheimia haemolytica]TRC48640.1 lactaldehyde reductase [Mannheimia haemolytica]
MANRLILNETSYHGKGAIQNIVHEVTSRSFKKALVVTDKDLIKFNVAQKVTALLDAAGLPYEIFDEVKANPAVDVIKAGVAKFKASGADYLIAIGGGSPIDSAKAIGIIINNPEFSDVLSLEGVAPTHQKCVPIIAIPTTAGTAAEVTINYVITDEAKKRKFVCVDVHDVPAVALVDPDMMESMPKSLAAATGMDALTHAIEGYITKAAWELTDALHLKAIELIGRSLRGAVEKNPKDVEAMALGQYVAGMGFSNVGLGVVHSMAHPLSAYYDTPHGIANAVLLPYVMEFNKNYTGEKYREIARAMGVKGVDEMSQEEYRNAAIAAVQQLSQDVGIPPKLHQIGVKEADLVALSVDAFNDVCTGGNPRDCTAEELLEVYRSAY